MTVQNDFAFAGEKRCHTCAEHKNVIAAIGIFKDDAAILARAISYIDREYAL